MTGIGPETVFGVWKKCVVLVNSKAAKATIANSNTAKTTKNGFLRNKLRELTLTIFLF
jgi:hypothetical protein